jgi:hypothetical protein
MNRPNSGAQTASYPSHGDQNRIGLRAVAAAIRYQGDTNQAERSFTQEPVAPAAVMTPSRDRDV